MEEKLERIIDAVSSLGITCMPTNRRELVFEDNNENQVEDVQSEFPFEDPQPKKDILSVAPAHSIEIPSYFRYFVDGSRRAFSVAEIIVNKKYYPVVGGQIGVAVIDRKSSRQFCPVTDLCHFKNVIVFPDVLSESDYDTIAEAIKKKGKFEVGVLKYKNKDVPNLVDLGIAKINAEMHQLELNAIFKLAKSGKLSDDRMLIIDGALKFEQKFEVSHFRNVLGIAKSFQSNLTIGKGRKKMDVGTKLKSMNFGDRTIVFGSKFKKHQLGTWYLKIRPKKFMNSPLSGVIKIEAFAVGKNEQENGLNHDRINNLSKCLLSERNVTAYGKDSRWPVHLYPIYLAESYIKSRFINQQTFMGAF